jgi:diaminopimelate decarboxylase
MASVARQYKPGVPHEDLPAAVGLLRSTPHVVVSGCHAHVGRHSPDLSLWREVVPCYVREIAAFAALMGDGWSPSEIDVGGGFSPRRDPACLGHISHDDEPRSVPTVAQYAEAVTGALRRALHDEGLPTAGVTLQIEPGRALYANAGVHLATVTGLKEEAPPSAGERPQRWVETDTSEAFLPDVNIEGTRWTVVPASQPDRSPAVTVDVVGISCGFDVLVAQVRLPHVSTGEILTFLDTGAYQDAGSSNFNAMPRPATVLVSGGDAEVVRRAETQAAVFARDVVPARLGVVGELSGRSGGQEVAT